MSLSGDKGVAQFKKSVKMEHPSKQLLCRWPIKKEVLEGGVASVGRGWSQPVPTPPAIYLWYGFPACNYRDGAIRCSVYDILFMPITPATKS